MFSHVEAVAHQLEITSLLLIKLILKILEHYSVSYLNIWFPTDQ
jgi:hypothetical protein